MAKSRTVGKVTAKPKKPKMPKVERYRRPDKADAFKTPTKTQMEALRKEIREYNRSMARYRAQGYDVDNWYRGADEYKTRRGAVNAINEMRTQRARMRVSREGVARIPMPTDPMRTPTAIDRAEFNRVKKNYNAFRNRQIRKYEDVFGKQTGAKLTRAQAIPSKWVAMASDYATYEEMKDAMDVMRASYSKEGKESMASDMKRALKTAIESGYMMDPDDPEYAEIMDVIDRMDYEDMIRFRGQSKSLIREIYHRYDEWMSGSPYSTDARNADIMRLTAGIKRYTQTTLD